MSLPLLRLIAGGAFLALLFLVSGRTPSPTAAQTNNWWNTAWQYRIPITVTTPQPISDHPVSFTISLVEQLQSLTPSVSQAPDLEHLRIVAQEPGSNFFVENIPVQMEQNNTDLTITTIVPGDVTNQQILFLYFDTVDRSSTKPTYTLPALVTTQENLQYQGQDSTKIKTPLAEYYYHKNGGGFASIIDVQGNDWISYKPGGGSAGEFRGIPNLVHPEGYFHPGSTNSTTLVDSTGPVVAKLTSTSNDNKWKLQWEIYPSYARMTLLKKSSQPYWFLYEGTPGGKISAGDYYVSSSHSKTNLSTEFIADLTDDEWIYFGDEQNDSVLFIGNAQKNTAIDSHRVMENNMTVFGFGRKATNKFLNDVPAVYTIGLTASNNKTTMAQIIAKTLVTPQTTVGTIEVQNAAPTTASTVQPTTIPETIVPTNPTCKTGDLDCSGKVNAADLTGLLRKFGGADTLADLDKSGKVNALDVTILLRNFGQ